MISHFANGDLPDLSEFTSQNRFVVWRTLFSMLEFKKITPQTTVDYILDNLELEDATVNVDLIDRNLSLILRRYFEDPSENYQKVFDKIQSLLVVQDQGELHSMNS